MLVAITRAVSRAITRCELTHLERTPIDLERARAQHRDYEAALARLGCKVISLPEEPELPDSVFVEDPAIVLDELAIITRPGAESRRPETATIRAALAPHRPLVEIEAPGILDGGDVMRIGKTLWIGVTPRSNPRAIAQMRERLAPLGYIVNSAGVHGCLHLKTAITAASDDTVLLNPEWVDAGLFSQYRVLTVDPSEPSAANLLRVGEHALFPTAFPKTRARLAQAGIETIPIDASELAKAEGALTCCSLIFTV